VALAADLLHLVAAACAILSPINGGDSNSSSSINSTNNIDINSSSISTVKQRAPIARALAAPHLSSSAPPTCAPLRRRRNAMANTQVFAENLTARLGDLGHHAVGGIVTNVPGKGVDATSL
jgi:hypothetical protein